MHLGVPPRKSLGVRLSAPSPRADYSACGLSASIRHAELRLRPLQGRGGLGELVRMAATPSGSRSRGERSATVCAPFGVRTAHRRTRLVSMTPEGSQPFEFVPPRRCSTLKGSQGGRMRSGSLNPPTPRSTAPVRAHPRCSTHADADCRAVINSARLKPASLSKRET